MLSNEDNERLTGSVPAPKWGGCSPLLDAGLTGAEIAVPDGPPVRLKLLGEDLVAFRDTMGRIGIIEAACAHRRASLFSAATRIAACAASITAGNTT